MVANTNWHSKSMIPYIESLVGRISRQPFFTKCQLNQISFTNFKNAFAMLKEFRMARKELHFKNFESFFDPRVIIKRSWY